MRFGEPDKNRSTQSDSLLRKVIFNLLIELKCTFKKQEEQMSEAKLVVIYPRPKDIEAFEKVYLAEHVPMAVEKLAGKTKIVATKVIASPQGTPPFYRIAEVYFPSMAALEACAATLGAQETLANAAKISTGGTPLFLVAEEETFIFSQIASA
jgi:uncharacterized protein (TIGR02118 family)